MKSGDLPVYGINLLMPDLREPIEIIECHTELDVKACFAQFDYFIQR